MTVVEKWLFPYAMAALGACLIVFSGCGGDSAGSTDRDASVVGADQGGDITFFDAPQDAGNGDVEDGGDAVIPDDSTEDQATDVVEDTLLDQDDESNDLAEDFDAADLDDSYDGDDLWDLDWWDAFDDWDADGEIDSGGPGTISIYLAGDLTERTFAPGTSGQTPRDYFIALSTYYILTNAEDSDPDLCFDHGDDPVVANIHRDNFMGACDTSSIPSATYTHGRVKVDWVRFTVDGNLHTGPGATFPGEFEFFRAFSDTEYDGDEYEPGEGFVTFSTIGYSASFPFTFPPLEDPDGGDFELDEDGNFWMTFPYGRPLPIISESEGEHWARFHWEIFEGFRWIDLRSDGFPAGVWDTTPNYEDGEEVVVPGVTGYYVTTSID